MPALSNHHAFAVHVAGISSASDYENRLFEAGCDDATVVIRDGAMHLDFEREAPAFSDAVASAMHDIEKAGGVVVRVERVEASEKNAA
jgi:hypothetical protein